MLSKKEKASPKTVRIHRQHDNHYWIEEEDLAKLVPELELDSSVEITVIRTEALVAEIQEKYMEALRGMWKTIQKDLQKKGLTDEEQFKAMDEGWFSAGKAEAYNEVLGLFGESRKGIGFNKKEASK